MKRLLENSSAQSEQCQADLDFCGGCPFLGGPCPDFCPEDKNNPLESASPYLEPNGYDGGVTENKIDLELSRAGACRKSYVNLRGEKSDDDYYKRVDCFKWWCPDCGRPGGAIHTDRKAGVYERVDVDKAYALRQLIFTVPSEFRDVFMSKKGGNQLCSAAKRIVMRFFPDRGYIGYFHAFGDRRLGTYAPHVNVHVVELESCRLKISDDKREGINQAWLRALRGLGCSGLSVVNVRYSWRRGRPAIMHAVRYMTRPIGLDHLEYMDDETKRALVIDMKNYKYLRFWGLLSNKKYKEGCMRERISRDEREIGEKLRYVGTISSAELFMKYQPGMDMEEVRPGLYRVKRDRNDRFPHEKQRRKKNG